MSNDDPQSAPSPEAARQTGEQIAELRRKNMSMLMQLAGEAMERMRVQESGLFDVNSVESKVYRAGMVTAAMASSEQVASATYQAIMQRLEQLFQAFVTPLETAAQEAHARLGAIEERLAKLEARE